MPSAPDPIRLDVGLAELAPRYDVVLCDVWGVVHNGVRHHPRTVEALTSFRRAGGTVILITNAPAPRAQVIRRLQSLAVPAEAYDDVATSGDVTIDMIVEAGCPPVFGIGPAAETALYEEAGRRGPRVPPRVGIGAASLAVCIGLDETGDTPEAYDPALEQLFARGLDLICANPDIVVEVGSERVYCAGAIAARYEALGGPVVQAGKPYPAIYERALAMAARVRGQIPQRDRVLAIGDALHTDMVGARDKGFDALFVTKGIHRVELHDPAGGTAPDVGRLRRLFSRYEVAPIAAVAELVWR